MTQKVVKFKWSLIREGVEVLGIWDEASNSFWVGSDFKKEGSKISLIPTLIPPCETSHLSKDRIFVRNLHENRAYIIIPDYQYDIFTDLVAICDLNPPVDFINGWSLSELNRTINKIRSAVYNSL